MILLRQKQFAALSAGAKVARNIWYRVGKRLQPLIKKSDEEILKSAISVGRKTNKIIQRPLAVGAKGIVTLVSRPLEAIGMPLVFAPELISTAIGGGMVAVGKGLRKIKPIGRASESVANYLKNTNLYRRAQNSTRGFHNNFELPKGIYYTGLGLTAATPVVGGGILIERKKKKKANPEPEVALA